MPKNLPLHFIRIIAGVIFITEGILKFVYPNELGWSIRAYWPAHAAFARPRCRLH